MLLFSLINLSLFRYTYAALAAFAQFASDLDPQTKARIERGLRITEILKQKQYEPMSMEHQAAILYAAINGFLDDLSVEKVKDWENKFHKFLSIQKKDLVKALADKKELTEEIEAKLKQSIEEFKKSYG